MGRNEAKEYACSIDDRPLDGVSLLPLLRNEMEERPSAIPYRFLEGKNAMFGSPTLALMGNRYKYLTNLSEDGAEDMMFDILEDPFETTNLIHEQKETAEQMRAQLEAFMASCRQSHFGADYPEPYEPVNDFQEITGTWLG